MPTTLNDHLTGKYYIKRGNREYKRNETIDEVDYSCLREDER